jgi:hypothetical protein
MIKTGLIGLLRTFSSKEIKEFGDFVRSPFFNKNESVTLLYDYLRKYHPDFEESKVIKERVHSKIFGAAEYNDGFMRKIIFNLNNLAEEYIKVTGSGGDQIESGLLLIAELNNRKLDKQFLKHFADLNKEVEITKDKNYQYYRRKFALEVNRTRYIDNNRYKVDLHDKKEYYNEQISEKLFYFTNYFLLGALDMYRTLKYQNYTGRFEFNDKLLNNIIRFLLEQLNQENISDPPNYIDNLTTRVYLYEIMLMNNKSLSEDLSRDKYFKKLKEILSNETEYLSHDSRFSLFNILVQHCSNRILRGFSEYRNERWELDKIALTQGIYMSVVETSFPPPAFASIVRDAAEVNEIIWARSFIENYKKQLEPINFGTVLNLSYSLIHFHGKEYQKALDYLNKIKPIKRWEFKFAVKELTLMVYYELSLFTQAYYLIDSFRHFISSMAKNFSSERIESRNNFLKYYTGLLKLKENSVKNELIHINKDLKDTHLLIFNRDWLREKAAELKTKLK